MSSDTQLPLQEKTAVTPQETDPDWPVSVQESLVEVWGGGVGGSIGGGIGGIGGIGGGLLQG